MKLIASGDTIVTCPYTRDYAGYEELAAVFQRADVRMNNMESPLLTGPCAVSAFSGRPWIHADPSLLDELSDFDFNCYSFANNHSLDYFYSGLLSTLEAFGERKLPFAGAGRSLCEASGHLKVETPSGSLSMIAVTTTGETSAIAGDPRGEILPRPGVNMLRHRLRFSVTEAQMKALQEIAEDSEINSRLKNRLKLGSVVLQEDIFPFGDMAFTVGQPGRMTEPDENDMARLEKAVRAAVKDADRTVVYVHSHESKGRSDAEPDFFVETFARACIDWGADAVLGSGTHQVKGVEIYRGKPIFYCMGNFFFRPFDMPEYPNEWYELYHMDPSLSPREAEMRRTKNHTIGLVTQAYCYRAIAPWIEWDEGEEPVKIAAVPLGLGFSDPEASRGFPRIAGPEETEALYEQLTTLCAPYGTKVRKDENGLLLFTKA